MSIVEVAGLRSFSMAGAILQRFLGLLAAGRDLLGIAEQARVSYSEREKPTVD